MPVKRRYQKKKKVGRRRYRRYAKKRMQARGTNIQKQLVIADRTFTKFKYSETDIGKTIISLAVGANQVSNTYFANNLFQHYSGATTVIPGLQEWAAFYARYRVHAVKVKCYMVSNDATSTGATCRPLLGFIHLQSDPAPSGFTSWATLRNLQGNRYSTFKPLAITEAGGQVQPTFLKKYYKLGPATGSLKQFLVDDTYEGICGSVPGGGGPVGPSRQFNYYIGLMTMDGSTVTGAAQNVSVMLTTTLYVEFKDRIDLAQ